LPRTSSIDSMIAIWFINSPLLPFFAQWAYTRRPVPFYAY
jgi:hypothetical protein